MSKLVDSQASSEPLEKKNEDTNSGIDPKLFEQGNKNDIIDNINVINYQLREPISSIFASLPTLANSINSCDIEKANKSLQVIYEKSYALLKNVNNISLAAKIFSGNVLYKTTIDFSSLVESIASSSTMVLPNYVRIEKDIQNVGAIVGNSDMLSCAIFNLILNSIEYRKEDDVDIKITVQAAKNSCQLSYEDNSMGIKPEIVSSIFDYYYTANPYDDGEPSTKLGLGLYIVKAAVETAGGTILTSSEFGSGVKYIITMPICSNQKDLMIKSRPSDFVLNRYSDMFVQLCEYCILPDLQ